jgi:hypothetical protein
MANHAIQAAPNVGASPESRPTAADPDETEIAALAFQLWLGRGSPNGSDQDDWFRAESMLKRRSESTEEELAVSR